MTLRNGDIYYYYLDTDAYVPIKIETKRIVRGAEREYETTLGDYEEVGGWYLPYSVETNVKGSQDKTEITYDQIEANVPIADGRFELPAAQPQQGQLPDASKTQPKSEGGEKPPQKEPGKPPRR